MGIIFTGSRHSIRPSLNLDFANSKALDPRITFTRASNATYYDGYTSVKAEENLVTYSNNFDSWNKNSASITENNTTSPSGATDASLLESTSNTSQYCGLYSNTISVQANQRYILHCYVKNNNTDYIALGFLKTTWDTVGKVFDISTGTLSGVYTVHGSNFTFNDASITSVGGGWYKLQVEFTPLSSFTGTARIGLSRTTGIGALLYQDTSNIGEGFYLWNMQLEQRDTVTAYTPTTSQPITKYQPALQTAGNNVARFDHNPTTGESLGLLIEEQRTNLAARSEEFDNAYWGKTNYTAKANQTIAPDGTLSADLLILDDGVSAGVTKSITRGTFTTSGTSAFSIYIKNFGCTGNFYLQDGAGNGVNFNLENNTKSNFGLNLISSPVAEDVGNGWYRLKFATSTTINSFYMYQSGFTGNGHNGVFLWGAQFEEASFPASYIKTTSSTVTRSADLAEMNNIDTSDWYNQKEGAVFVETAPFNPTNGFRPQGIHISDGTSSERIGIHTGLNGHLYIRTSDGVGANLTVSSSGVTANTFSKYSASWELNNVAVSVNGSVAVEDTDCSLPRNINKINIMAGATGSVDDCSSWVKKLAFYPIRLTNNELQDLSEE